MAMTGGKQWRRKSSAALMLALLGGLGTAIAPPVGAQVAVTELRFDSTYGNSGELQIGQPTAQFYDRKTGRILVIDLQGRMSLFDSDGSLRPGFPVALPPQTFGTVTFFRPDGSACAMFNSFNSVSRVQCWNEVGKTTGPAVIIPGESPKPIPGTSDFLISSGLNPVRLERRRADGSLDQSFGTAGVVEIPAPEPATTANTPQIRFDEAGRILIVGPTSFTVTRILANGAKDPSFGSTAEPGLARISEDRSPLYVGDLGNGYLFSTLVVGERAMQRLRYDGTRDTTFGTVLMPNPVQYRPDGTGPLTTGDFNYGSPVIGADSMVYVIGSVSDSLGTTFDTVAVRFTSDGQRDLSFGENGVVTNRRGSAPPTNRIAAVAVPGSSFLIIHSGATSTSQTKVRRINVAAGCSNWTGSQGSGPRQLDTRAGNLRFGMVNAACTVTVPIRNPLSAPISAGSSVILNLTATQPTQASYVTAWPSGQPRPTTSTLNFAAGQTIPNAAIVKLGVNNGIDLFNANGSTHLLADVNGILPSNQYTGLAPTRLLDTRSGIGVAGPGSIGPGQTITLRVAGLGTAVPATAAAVSLNVTVTDPSATSFLTVWPTGTPAPNVSSLNMTTGTTIANLVIVKPGTNGDVSIRNDSGITQVIADLNGYFMAGTATTFVPQRLLDTRIGIGAPTGAVGSGQTVAMQVTGTAQIPTGATGSIVLNVTATEPTATSYITVWPTGTTFPNSSNLNFVRGQTIPNLVVVPIGANGTVNLTNANGSVHLIADISAYIPA
jgi:Domain of unknown function (DUF5122) beta-propeller